MSQTEDRPRTDEVWRGREGETRIVAAACEDGLWVMYRRPAPAPEEAITVTGEQWRAWKARKEAVRMKKAWRAHA